MNLPIRFGITAATLLVVGAGYLLATGDDTLPAETTDNSAPPVVTDTVRRQTLQQSEEFTGSLGYGDQFALPGMATGTVTWVPEEESILQPGDLLYRVDNRPTYWTRGVIPMYRELSSGTTGADVEQLQLFLQSEGFLDEDFVIDAKFGPVTRSAVKEWQDARGLEKTGRVGPEQLLFLPYEAVRVATAPRVGEQASGGVLDVTKSDLYVSTIVNGRKKRVFEGSPTIEVRTADGSRYSATVESIEARQSQDAFGQQEYAIRLSFESNVEQRAGEVKVAVIDVLADNAITVPARALVALVEGGYAVEKVGPDGTAGYVAVTIGEFADGWVEVDGDLTEGDVVVVPE